MEYKNSFRDDTASDVRNTEGTEQRTEYQLQNAERGYKDARMV